MPAFKYCRLTRFRFLLDHSGSTLVVIDAFVCGARTLPQEKDLFGHCVRRQGSEVDSIPWPSISLHWTQKVSLT